jgi:hypothetical protein
MKSIKLFIFLLLSTTVFSASAQEICYGLSDNLNCLFSFKRENGNLIAARLFDSLTSPEASCLNLASDTLFVIDEDVLHYVPVGIDSLNNTKIIGSDISTQKLSGDLGSLYANDFDAMGIDSFGNIWAGTSNANPCLLVVIDRNTGMVQNDFFGSGKDYLQVQNSNDSTMRFDGLAFDPITNTMYAAMNASNTAYSYMFTINTSSGSMNLVHRFDSLVDINDVEGVCFDASGKLLVVTGADPALLIQSRIWDLNLITKDVTQVFYLRGEGDLESCICTQVGGAAPIDISGYVFHDIGNDTLFNTGDTARGGYLISLYKDANSNGSYDKGTDYFVDSMRTLDNGFYQFRVAYDSGTNDFVLMSEDITNYPFQAFFTTDNMELASFSADRQTDINNNFGYSIDSTFNINFIAGNIYADKNSNAKFDSGEKTVENVLVRLYDDDNCNGEVDNAEAVLDSITVGTDGFYRFRREFDSTFLYKSESLTAQVNHIYDDSGESSAGKTMNRTGKFLMIGKDFIGLRFQDLSIPQGAIITKAYLQFTAERTDTFTARAEFYGEDVDDANQFTPYTTDISGRQQTTASVSWIPEGWLKDSLYNSPELKNIVHEIVNRSGWVSGNNLAVLIKPIAYSGPRRWVLPYDVSTSRAPKLIVEYTYAIPGSNKNCFVTAIDESTKPTASTMTTDNIEEAEFTEGGNTDSNNDFGMWGGALPVQWLSFKGKYIGAEVELDWSTAMEDNNSHFIVERSPNGSKWQEIGEVAAVGFSTEITSYTFLDGNPFNEINYYRIKQVDFDAHSSSGKVIVLDKKAFVHVGISIVPNPAGNMAEISWTASIKTGQLLVTDMKGVVVFDSQLSSSKSQIIDLTNLERGFYMVDIRTPNQRFTKKILHK